MTDKIKTINNFSTNTAYLCHPVTPGEICNVDMMQDPTFQSNIQQMIANYTKGSGNASANGWLYLGNNTVLEWYNASANTSGATITLPKAMDDKNYFVCPGFNNKTGTGAISTYCTVIVKDQTTTNFKAFAYNANWVTTFLIIGKCTLTDRV